MKNFEKSLKYQQTIEKGSRFCSDLKNKKFMYRNKVYLPYCYHTLMLIRENQG